MVYSLSVLLVLSFSALSPLSPLSLSALSNFILVLPSLPFSLLGLPCSYICFSIATFFPIQMYLLALHLAPYTPLSMRYHLRTGNGCAATHYSLDESDPLEYFAAHTNSVEIVRDGVLYTAYFPVPSICRFITDDSQQEVRHLRRD